MVCLMEWIEPHRVWRLTPALTRYTGQEYDLEFIAVLRQECQKFIWRSKQATVGATLSAAS